MTPLSSHYFGERPSEAAFGHAGQGGTSFAMADPERDLVIGGAVQRRDWTPTRRSSFRRVNLVDAIYRALDQLD